MRMFCTGQMLTFQYIYPTKIRTILSCHRQTLQLHFFTMKNHYKTPLQQRKNERVNIALPVKVSDQSGISRDASAGGILFELNHFNEVGSEISFELELDTPNGKMKLKCTGDIVRTESKGSKTAIAVKITDSQFE